MLSPFPLVVVVDVVIELDGEGVLSELLYDDLASIRDNRWTLE